MSEFEKQEQTEIDAAIARHAKPSHPMRHPTPHKTPEENLAYWDIQREIALARVVHCTQMRVFFAGQVRALGEFGQPLASVPPPDPPNLAA